ncbi:MAG: translation initiation factor IF-2 [Cyclobacteriaceae bacterium]|nr:translation initiation factor IF-2 [Cyclobacteriaceae bacterium]
MAERTMRLSQVARKLNIGKNTILDFLAAKGHQIENNPNSKIDEEQLNLLSKEFAGSAHDKEEASGLTIGSKHNENVVINTTAEAREKELEDEEEEIFIKNMPAQKQESPKSTDAIKPESPKLPGIKVVGKIDLDKKEKITPEASSESKVKSEESETPVEKPAKIEAEEKKTQPEEKPEKPLEVKADAEVKEEKPKESDAKPSPIEVEKQPAPEPSIEKEEKPVVTAAPEAKEEVPEVTPKKEEKEIKSELPVEAKADPEKAKDDNLIEARAETLKGLKVIGRIELPVEKARKSDKPVASSDDQKEKDKKKKKRPRKRIRKDQPGTEQNKPAANGGVNKPKSPQETAAKGGGGGTQDQRKRHQRPAPKPKKEEVSDKEIQEQIKQTLARLSGGGKTTGTRSKYRKEKRHAQHEAEEERMLREQEKSKVLKVNEFISANDLASLMNVSVNDVISVCLTMGLFVSINQRLDAETITIIADEFGFGVDFSSEEDTLIVENEEDTDKDLLPRAPIVTIMGHVDHGKTSLLDFIRSAKVTEGEAGGITQHIGAYDVVTNSGKRVTFLDTPGHEAFTAMRARGAKVTDIVVIVVAADDHVMPQTKEAINHAQVAGVPIVFAINKIDKPNANPEKVKEELANINMLVEDWGGKYQSQEISAKTGFGIDDLLEKVLLEAELLELKANPNKNAIGTVVEASLDKGRGYVTTILVQTGTLNIGDIILAGAHHGRVKAMFDHRGKKIKSAGPSSPVLVLGLDGAPQAGDKFNVMSTEREAREIANKREQLLREQSIRTRKHITLDEIGRRLAIGSFKELNVIVKGDVDGSIEALSDSLLKLSTQEVQVNIIHKAVGQISESDVLLASASDAIIVGFQVRPSNSARKLAEQEEIEIRLYSIIYDAINEIKDALEGMLAPEVSEVITSNVEVRDVFRISKVGTVAGCMVTDGSIKRNSKIRLVRDGIVIYSGEIDALKRFKEDVSEVKNGYECGVSIKNFNDIKVGDVIESYEERETKRKL